MTTMTKGIRHLSAAIRKHDKRHLITVGLVPWSLPRKSLTSDFEPQRIAGDLDFVSVRLYPEEGKINESIETLRAFCVGKPVVIEEIFPLEYFERRAKSRRQINIE